MPPRRIRHPPSRSAIALRTAIGLRPDLEAALANVGVTRGDIWRWTTGRVIPGAVLAGRVHRVTGGAVPADGWEPIAAAPPPEPTEPDAAPVPLADAAQAVAS